MIAYKHTQRGTLMIAVMSIASVVLLVLALTLNKGVLGGFAILVLAGWLFHSLTIEISGGELRWRFGPGLIRKRVPLAQIVSAQPVRTNFLEGWGIHWSRFGWLYNVSGLDAVAITLHSGKRFALGTDEPQALASELEKASRDPALRATLPSG